jgi:hypothetical protein
MSGVGVDVEWVDGLDETRRTGHTNELFWTVPVGHVGRGEAEKRKGGEEGEEGLRRKRWRWRV